jgi:hypothetical protein
VPVIALCQHPAVRIEHAGGKIAGFAHDGGKRRPLQVWACSSTTAINSST